MHSLVGYILYINDKDAQSKNVFKSWGTQNRNFLTFENVFSKKAVYTWVHK